MNEKRKKVLKMIWILPLVAVVIAIIVTSIVLFNRVPIVYDIENIQAVENKVLKLSRDDERNSTGHTALVKMENGRPSEEEFKILFFTDLHINERKAETTKTIAAFVETIQAERPDLVVLTGDIIVGRSNHKRIEQFNEIMGKLGVYWAPILGNHEGDSPLLLSKEDTVKSWSNAPYCLVDADAKYTQSGELVSGYGNYVFSILNSEYAASKTFVMLDGGDRVSRKEAKELNISKRSYDFIKPTQIKWYKEVIDDINIKAGKNVESMLCVHIPIYQYLTAIEYDGVNKKIIKVAEGWELVYGVAGESISCCPYDSGIYEALVEKGTRFVFVGHDHVNDYIVKNTDDEVYLVYVRSGGYATYDAISRGLTTDEKERMQGYNTMFIDNDGAILFKSQRYADNIEETILED